MPEADALLTDCRLGNEAVLVLVDGPAVLPEVPLHEPSLYALFYFLRGLGTLQLSMDQLASLIEAVRTPEGQLQALNQFQPALDVMSQDAWDVAVYSILDKAAVVTRLMDKHEGQHQQLRSSVALMESADMYGQSFDRVTKALSCGSMQHIKLAALHTQCLFDITGQHDITRHLLRTIHACTRLV